MRMMTQSPVPEIRYQFFGSIIPIMKSLVISSYATEAFR